MAATDENVVQVVELTKVFRDFWGRQKVKALDGLDFNVKRGEVFGLLGPNGSGKTTCVRIVLGLLFPTSGAVQIFGRSPRRVDVKKRVGYMPEESHLYSYLNAEETLDFFGRLFRLPPEERRNRSEALIEMVGLQRARRRPIGQFSKGMARRIGLAQALINDPDLVILDEPTTGLDPIGSREIKDLIAELKEMGKTVLLCSHLLGDVEEVCDRICILYGGRHRALGPVEELLMAEDTTQINLSKVDDGLLQRVVQLIRQATDGETPVEISTPSRRLEEFFLEVVEQARREKVATAGAERGTPAAGFLGGQEESERVLEELMEAARTETTATDSEGQKPRAAMQVGEDRQFIDTLVTDEAGSAEQAEPEEAGGSTSATPETEVRKDVLDELTEDSASRSGERDEEDAE